MFNNLLIDDFEHFILDSVLLSEKSSVGACFLEYQPDTKCNLLYKVSDFVAAGCIVVTGIVGAVCDTERVFFDEDATKQGGKLFSSVAGLTFEEFVGNIEINAVTRTGQPVLKEKSLETVRGRLSTRSDIERVAIPGSIEIGTHTLFMTLEDGSAVSLGNKFVKDSIGYLVVSKVLRSDGISGHHYEFVVKQEV